MLDLNRLRVLDAVARTGSVTAAAKQLHYSQPSVSHHLARREHPGLQLSLTDTHPVEALGLLRAGHVDLALIFRYDESPPEDEDIRLVHLLDDPTYLLTTGGPVRLADHRESTWVAGCERCR